jgi:hypothetical protein
MTRRALFGLVSGALASGFVTEPPAVRGTLRGILTLDNEAFETVVRTSCLEMKRLAKKFRDLADEIDALHGPILGIDRAVGRDRSIVLRISRT